MQKKLLASVRLRIGLAAASVLVLIAGASLAPRQAPSSLRVSEERAAPLLEEQVQQREAVEPFRGVAATVARVQPYGVEIAWRSDAPPVVTRDFLDPAAVTAAAGRGVFVSSSHVLTHLGALGAASAPAIVTADARTLDSRAVAYDPTTGLILLETAPLGQAPPIAKDTPPIGALVVAAGGHAAGYVAAPAFITAVSPQQLTIGTLGLAMPPGLPLYTVDGELFAVSAEPDGTAYRVRETADRLMARAASGERVPALGLTVQALTADLAPVFGEAGAVITAVVPGGPADTAQLAPGDVIVAIGGEPTKSPADLTRATRMLMIEEPAAARVRRGARERDVRVTPAPAYAVALRARLFDTATPEGPPRAGLLFDAQLLEDAGIAATAEVLAVNGRTLTTAAQVQNERRRARRPVAVLLRHGGLPYFDVIPRLR